MMRGAVLGAALLLWPLPGLAQGLGAEIADLLRARGCAMEEVALAEVFTVMGRSPEEIRAAVLALVAAGSASRAGGELRLAPLVCRGAPVKRVPPLPWIEERLAEAPGCGRGIEGLRVEAEAEGVGGMAFDRVLAALRDLGRVAVEDGTARLRPGLCEGSGLRDLGLYRVLVPGRDSYRAILGMLALERGCRVALGDREGLLRDLGLLAQQRLFLGAELTAEASGALELRLVEVLDAPGPGFRRMGDELVAIYCQP